MKHCSMNFKRLDSAWLQVNRPLETLTNTQRELYVLQELSNYQLYFTKGSNWRYDQILDTLTGHVAEYPAC